MLNTNLIFNTVSTYVKTPIQFGKKIFHISQKIFSDHLIDIWMRFISYNILWFEGLVCDKDDSIIKIYTYFIFYNGKPSHSDVLWEKNAIPCCPNMPVEIQMFGMIGVPKQLKYLYLSSHLIQSNVTPKQ